MESRKFFSTFVVVKVATIGFFDGVHLGHRHLIGEVRGLAKNHKEESVVITFSEHPLQVICPQKMPKLLTTYEEKLTLLKEIGVDEVCTLPFTKELAQLSAKEFMQKVLKDRLRVGTLVLGYNHSFGNKNQGHDYEAYGKELGIEVVRASALEGVSSSVIRNWLSEGNVAAANEALGYRYFLEGKVVHGRQVGRKIGFPTANIEVDKPKLLPMVGAYGVRAMVDNQVVEGMMNVGKESIEVHLLDFEGNLYGKMLRVEIECFLRKEKTFATLEELRLQLEADKRQILSREF